MKKVVQLKKAPDGYRGSLDCVKFLDEEIVIERYEDNYGVRDVFEVFDKDRNFLGYLYQWYGSNGRGKLAAEEFSPAEGVTVEWLN